MKTLRLIVLFTFCVFVLSACSPAVAQFVQLPDPERVAVQALVTLGVGLLFAWIATKFPWTAPFLDKYKMELSIALGGVVVSAIEAALPSAYPELSIRLVQFLLAVIAAIGVNAVMAKAGVKGFRA